MDYELRSWDIHQRVFAKISQAPDSAIRELNLQMQQQLVGYRYESGELVRLDSQYLHSGAVKPTLSLLSERGFEGPNDEFLKAHEHYRQRRYKEAIVEAGKAFESTMKTICESRRWPPFAAAKVAKAAEKGLKPSASDLLNALFERGLIPPYLQSEFSSLKTVLESGVPGVRNNFGAHGQGATPVVVPAYLASYVLHLAAANILLLVEAHKEMPRDSL